MTMASSPYRLDGPALISFSGGRTSAFMLHEIMRAHDGVLPADVHVVFANTGKEREETLRFVNECAVRWGVHITWVERTFDAPGFEIVSHNSASRKGEPFAAIIAKKKRLPNWMERWCTTALKVEPMHAFMRQQGHEIGRFAEAIGLRDDEGLRIFKGLERADRDGRRILYPLARAKVRKPDVLAFWKAQPFDLKLAPHEGNCDLCFMKGRGLRKRIIRDDPDVAVWWQQQEQRIGRSFDRRDRVADLVEEVHRSPDLFDAFGEDDFDAECGLTCGAAA